MSQSLDEILKQLFIDAGVKLTDIGWRAAEPELTKARAAILQWARAQKPEKKSTKHPTSMIASARQHGWDSALDAYEAKFSNSEEETDG